MKRPTWKLVIAIAILAILAMGIMFWKLQNIKNHAAIGAVKQAEKAVFWQTKAGKYAADVAALELRLATVSIKQIAKDASVPIKRVKGVTTITTQQSRTIVATPSDTSGIHEPSIVSGVFIRDTSTTYYLGPTTKPFTQPTQLFHYKDEWIDIEARAGAIGLEIDYQVRDSISLIEYKDRGRKRYRAISHAPNTKITGLEALTIERNSRFSFGPFAGAALDVNTGKIAPVIGVGVSFSLIKM